MRWRSRIITLASFSLLFIASVMFAPASQAASGVGGRPALPREDEPRSQSIFLHTIKTGETIDDKVLVSNQTDKTETVLVYAVDAIATNTGSFTCKQKAEPSTDAGSWIHLAKSEVTLAAGKSDIVDFTITAPKNADVGEHNACLAFESKGDEGEINGNLRIRTRSAVRVALTIPGKLNRQLAIDSYTVTQDNFNQRYTIVLNNTGNVSADTDIMVELRTLLGGQVYANGGQYPILAGNKLELSFDNDKSPFFGGWFYARASAAYDKNTSTWGTQHTSDLTTLYAKDQLIFIWPQPLGLIIIFIILLAVIGLIMYPLMRKRQRKVVRRSGHAYHVKHGDTIQSLAKHSGVSWKRLATMNRLKAPYALEEGKIIYLPKVKTARKKNNTKKG